MSRLFESKEPAASPPREDDPGLAREAIAAAELDENARRLEQLLGASRTVAPVNYTRERRGSWTIEHGRAGDDYFFQLHPPKTASRPWQDVMASFIAVMDGIFPRSVQIHYRRPDEQWEIKFFTVRVENVCRVPGWETAIKRAIDALGHVATG